MITFQKSEQRLSDFELLVKARAEITHLQKSNSAIKGVITKLKNRYTVIGDLCCNCCEPITKDTTISICRKCV